LGGAAVRADRLGVRAHDEQRFNLHISGAQFTASLHLTSTACKQSLSIIPKGFDISRISIGLGKC
jgi:hypothetical protein